MTPTPSPRSHIYLHGLSEFEQLAIADRGHDALVAGRVPFCEWPKGDRAEMQEAAECAMLDLVVVRDMVSAGTVWF